MSFQRLRLLLVLAAFGVTSGARASAPYPPVVQSVWGGASLDCALCHQDEYGGGQVTKPFGKTLISYRLRKDDVSSLRSALEQAQRARSDSDRDGVSDYDELRTDETDPNDPKSFVEPAPPAQGGMTSQPATGGSTMVPTDAGSGGTAGTGEPDPIDVAGSFSESCIVRKRPHTYVGPLPEHGCAFAPARSGSGLAVGFALILWFQRRRKQHTLVSSHQLLSGD